MTTLDQLARPPATDVKAFRQHVEHHARELRRRAGIGLDEPFDPRLLTHELKIRLADLDEIDGLSSEDRDLLSTIDARTWSGAGVPLPDGYTLVLLHPGQTRERATATIMEEVCHSYFGHAPTRLVTLPGGIVKREYRLEVEREAYWTGAAALLPSHIVARAVWRGDGVELASIYGVSTELVDFRIKILGLWWEHRKDLTN